MNADQAEDFHTMENCRCVVVTSDDSDEREWLKDSVYCGLLSQFNIRHVGVMYGQVPLEITRVDQDGSYFMACIDGEGNIWSDGSWVRLKAGQATLLPPFVLNSLHCVEESNWTFCWVRYSEARSHAPISSIISPSIIPYDASALASAILGLHSECSQPEKKAIRNLWVDIIHKYVLDFTSADQHDERLYRLWTTVEKGLHHPWTLADMAKVAGMSGEHLRRLCHKLIGRTPMQQLTFLRMQRARHMLVASEDKISSIAFEVGYQNPFTFSDAFKKWIGRRPSEIRKQGRKDG